MPDTVLREIRVKPPQKKRRVVPTAPTPKRDYKLVLWAIVAISGSLGGAIILGQQMTSSPLMGNRVPAPAASSFTERLLPEARPVETPRRESAPRRTSYISPASPANRSFDSVFVRRADGKVEGPQRWEVHAGTSDLDDSPRVVLALPSNDQLEGQGRTSLPELVLRCEEGALDAYVRLGIRPASALRSGGQTHQAEGRIRVDEGEAEDVVFTRSTDGKSIFFPHPNVLLARLEKAGDLLLEIAPSGARPQTATFDLTGLSRVVPPLYEACRG